MYVRIIFLLNVLIITFCSVNYEVLNAAPYNFLNHIYKLNFSASNNLEGETKAIAVNLPEVFQKKFKKTKDYQSIYDISERSEEVDEDYTLDIKTLLDDVVVNNIDSFSKNELIKQEIQKLNQELDDLNNKLRVLQKENVQLKNEINKYNDEVKLKEQKNNLIDDLKKEARDSKINLDIQNTPDEYIMALDLLIIGNIELAQNKLTNFIQKYSLDSKNTKYLSNKVNTYFIAYSYYWLGKINNINQNYNVAAEKFSFAYKFTNFSTLSLLSLLGVIESLTNLSKNTEACVGIKQFMQDYEKASKDKNLDLNQINTELVENFKSINRCQ